MIALPSYPTPSVQIEMLRPFAAAPDPNIAALMQAVSQIQSTLVTQSSDITTQIDFRLQSALTMQSNNLTSQLDARTQSALAPPSSALTIQLNSQAATVGSLTSQLDWIEQSQRPQSQQSQRSV